MNTITNYRAISLQAWQRMAHAACYAVDQSIKSEAERLFYQASQSPELELITSLMNSGSDTLLFVLFSYLGKNHSVFWRDLQNVQAIIQCIYSWQFKDFTFIRPNQPPLQRFVARTIMTSLGVFLKILYENQNAVNQVIDFVNGLGSGYFKLYLLKSFVDAIEVIDYEMGYMKYRTMVYSFQDKAIPMICETLMPYFYKIEEGVLIKELNLLQDNMNINDVDTESSGSQQVAITSDEELQSDYVFMLLQKIVQFNYNITYSEYESDQPIETCLITLPDKVSEKIINSSFLDALFFIIEKISSVKIGTKKHEYLQISLSCISKMMQSRMSYIQSSVKEQYFYHALMGLTHLLIKCQEIGSQPLLEGILICNRKLYMNCELNFLRTICIKNSNNQSAQLYHTYLKDLTSMIVVVVQNSYIQTENHLLLEAVELALKLIASHGGRDNDNSQDMFFADFTKAIIYAFLDNLTKPKSIMMTFKIVSIAENKTMISQLFEAYKKIASSNFEFFFASLLDKIDNFAVTSQDSIVTFANLLLLISEVVDHNYLQRNIFLNRANDAEYCVLGRVINKASNLASQYVASRNGNHQACMYVDTAVVIFTESVAIEFLNGFQYANRFKIRQKLYLLMVYGQYYNESRETQDDKSQETILVFIRILTEYLHFSSNTSDNEVIIQYVLNALQKCIFKLKWHMKRQYYLKTQIFHFLSSFFESFFYDRHHIGDVRSRVAKIVVTLTFDDVLDEYKFRIKKFLNILTSQPIEYLHYDLIGIYQGIETHAISKYFYNRSKIEIDYKMVLTTLYETAIQKNQEKSYRDFCKLSKAVLNNKGFKISNANIIYELFKLNLPFLNNLLKTINRGNYISLDLWQSSIIQIMQIFKGFVGGTHINIYLLETYTQFQQNGLSLIKQFTIQIMKTIILLFPQVQSFPEMEQITLTICTQINKELLNYIFSDSTSNINEVYALMHVKMVDLTIIYINLLNNGNKVLEDKLVKALDCLRYFYVYFNKKCKFTHQKAHLFNLNQIYSFTEKYSYNEVTISKNEQLIEYIINFILTNHKNNISFLKTVTRLLFELNKIFNHLIIKIMGKLQLREEKFMEIGSILSQELGLTEQGFIDRMKTWIRQVDIFM